MAHLRHHRQLSKSRCTRRSHMPSASCSGPLQDLLHWVPCLHSRYPFVAYSDWNVVYPPLERETQAAMGGGLPLHPRQSIGPIDELMCERIGGYCNQFQDAKRKVD